MLTDDCNVSVLSKFKLKNWR